MEVNNFHIKPYFSLIKIKIVDYDYDDKYANKIITCLTYTTTVLILISIEIKRKVLAL